MWREIKVTPTDDQGAMVNVKNTLTNHEATVLYLTNKDEVLAFQKEFNEFVENNYSNNKSIDK